MIEYIDAAEQVVSILFGDLALLAKEAEFSLYFDIERHDFVIRKSGVAKELSTFKDLRQAVEEFNTLSMGSYL